MCHSNISYDTQYPSQVFLDFLKMHIDNEMKAKDSLSLRNIPERQKQCYNYLFV